MIQEEWVWANRNLSHKELATELGRGERASRVRRYEIQENLVAALEIACQNDYTQESIQEAITWLKKRPFLENDLREIAADKPCLEDIKDHVKRYRPLPDTVDEGLDGATEGGLPGIDGLDSLHAEDTMYARAPDHAYRERTAAGGDKGHPFALSAAGSSTLQLGLPFHHDIGARTLDKCVPLDNRIAAHEDHIQQTDLNYSFRVSLEEEQRDTGRKWNEQTAEILFAASQLFPLPLLGKRLPLLGESYEEFYSYLMALKRGSAAQTEQSEQVPSTGLSNDEQSPETIILNASRYYETLERTRHDNLEPMNASIPTSRKRNASGADETQIKRVQQNAMAHHISEKRTEESLGQDISRKRPREAISSLTDYNLHEPYLPTNMTDSAELSYEPSKRRARTAVPAPSSSQTPPLPNLHQVARGHDGTWRSWSHHDSDDNEAILRSIQGNIVLYQDAVLGKKSKGIITRHPPTFE